MLSALYGIAAVVSENSGTMWTLGPQSLIATVCLISQILKKCADISDFAAPLFAGLTALKAGYYPGFTGIVERFVCENHRTKMLHVR